jgi:serine/threonine-protein kinase RsbW
MRPARLPAPASPEPRRAMLLLPVELSSLPIIGARLRAFAEEAAGPIGEAKELHELRLAVQEYATNVIKHGRIEEANRRLVVRFELFQDLLTVFITDQGEAFDPRREATLPGGEEDPAEGGYGLFLIQALVDEIRYETTESGNTLILRKQLPARDEL